MTHPDLVAAIIVGLLTMIAFGVASTAEKANRIIQLLEIANDQRNDERIERQGDRFD